MKARVQAIGVFLLQAVCVVLAILFMYVMSLAMSGELVTGRDSGPHRTRTAEERAEAQPDCDYESSRVC